MKRNLYCKMVMLLALTMMRTNLFAQANTSLSNLVATNINQPLTPNANNSLSLGSITRSWRFLYLDSAVYLRDIAAIHARGSNNFFAGLGAGNFTLTGTA